MARLEPLAARAALLPVEELQELPLEAPQSVPQVTSVPQAGAVEQPQPVLPRPESP
jgi:hypothetical protein